MKEFKVIVEVVARQDMLDIRRYISKTLKDPVAAKRIYESMKAAILTLDHSPLRHAVVRDEPYASLELRRLFIENYTAFYLVDAKENEVHVIRVLYNRREWQNLL